MTQEWTSDTGTPYTGNHNVMGVAETGERTVVGVSLNGLDGADYCGVVALDAAGNALWRAPLPPEHCTDHAISDVGVGEFTDADHPEFLVGTISGSVLAYDAVTGEETFRRDLLDSIPFGAPVVANVDDDGTRELAVVDFAGNLSVVRPDGSVAWARTLELPVYVAPLLTDVTNDGTAEIVVNHGDSPSELICFGGGGELVWRVELEGPARTWSLVERANGPVLVGATGDRIVSLDGRTGERRWTTSLDAETSVGGSDRGSVYTAARDGVVRALSLDDGGVRWRTRVTGDGVRTSAPALGSITGTDAPEVAVTAHDGTVAVLESGAGELRVGRELDADLYASPVPVDVSGDGRDDLLALYSDGRVAAFSYRE